jgi:two-component system osmolarity sensor histidine kinase EnvZ
MLAGVSHDLRTPLTRMKLQLAMLPAGPETSDLKADVTEMERMVDGYLAFARGADGEAAQLVDVAELVNQAAQAARREGAEVAVSAPAELQVWLKPQAVRRCLANLIDNACRYAKHTAVQVAREPHALLIAVEDDGPGIPKAEREAVFRPFYRLENSRNKDTGGVGLGLAIARDAIRSHGGDVTLEDAPAGGLRAVVRLPL